MCGILGSVGVEMSSMENALSLIKHRGPDDFGSIKEGNVFLGHRRLSIVDLSENGHQPMTSNDDQYTIIFNGEIYNHLEIRTNLLKEGYTFKSHSDTETLLYAYIEYGPSVLNKLNGIFSFAIFNRNTKELFIARDQFGIKPLYYILTQNKFLFGSEIKSLLAVPGFDGEIDQNALAHYLYFLWSPGENTPYKNCKKLLPGHYITIQIDQLPSFSIHKYYEIPFNGTYEQKTEQQWIEELDQKLTKAVERQLLSDVPIGYFLSGGLDSSLIVAIAKKLNPQSKIKCFTIATETNSQLEGFVDDLPYAKKVADYLKVELEIVKADVDIVRDFDKMIYHLDEPQADAAPLNVANICKKAREQGFVVLLGGTAGDDLFSGYRRHQSLYYDEKFKILPYFVKLFIQKITSALPNTSAFTRRLRKLFSVYEYKDKLYQMASLYGWLPFARVKKLFIQNTHISDPSLFLKNAITNIPKEGSHLNQMLYWDMKYFLTDHNLNYTDKMSMMHGVEVRVPFLDVELVEFSTKIPPDLKMKGAVTKYLLKKVAEKYLPMDVIYRSKSGFGAPVRDWITKDLQLKIESELSKKELDKMGIFNSVEVERLIKENKDGKVDASYSIWCLLAIQSWFKQFVKK